MCLITQVTQKLWLAALKPSPENSWRYPCRRGTDEAVMEEHSIAPIDLVVLTFTRLLLPWQTKIVR